MPKPLVLEDIPLSPSGTVLDIVENILGQPTMNIHEKLEELHELCVERISFDSPERVVQIISVLAKIISSDPNPKVRAAALKVMEWMIILEEKAEAKQGKPAIDWHTVDVLLHKAQKQTTSDSLAMTARPVPASPEINLSPKIVLDMPVPVAERPQPHGIKPPAAEEKPEPPIMKFLRSVANTDDQEHIRELATRVIAKIQNLTAQESPLPSALTLTEG